MAKKSSGIARAARAQSTSGTDATPRRARATARKQDAPRAYHHGDLRRALIDAALALIAEGELGTLSLREVARRAGVTPGAPYHHFADKTALLGAVAEEGFLALTAHMESRLARVAAGDARGRIAALARAYVTFSRAHQSHYRVMFLPEVKHRQAAGSLHAAADASLGLLLAAIKADRPRDTDSAILARAVMAWSAGHGLLLLWNDGLLDRKFPARTERDFVDLAVDQMVTLALARG